MTTNDLALPRLRGSQPHPHLDVPGPGLRRLAAATLMSLGAVGAAWPALGQEANRLGLCSLSPTTIGDLQTDVATGLGIATGNVEVAFVVVYSLSNDNNGQPLAVGTSGPVLCANSAVTDLPEITFATDPIPPFEEDTVDILDSSEGFLLRYRESETTDAEETRFCHTTNANVDCFRLGPTPPPPIIQ